MLPFNKRQPQKLQIVIEKDPKTTLLETISMLDAKMDMILRSLNVKPERSRYMTAQDIQVELGIDQRTILNRSNLSPTDKNYIPSHRMGSRRKYFERKVIERFFLPRV